MSVQKQVRSSKFLVWLYDDQIFLSRYLTEGDYAFTRISNKWYLHIHIYTTPQKENDKHCLFPPGISNVICSKFVYFNHEMHDWRTNSEVLNLKPACLFFFPRLCLFQILFWSDHTSISPIRNMMLRLFSWLIWRWPVTTVEELNKSRLRFIRHSWRRMRPRTLMPVLDNINIIRTEKWQVK